MSRRSYNSTTIQVDDTDPAFLFSGNWTYRFPTPRDYNHTLHSTLNDGDTIQLPFTGTGIEVWGPMGSIDYDGQPVTTYSIDGGAHATFFAPYIAPGGWIGPQQFYQSPPLAAGEHTLLITNVNGTAPSRFNLDYVLITPSLDVSTTTGMSVPNGGSSTSQMSGANGGGSSTTAQMTSSTGGVSSTAQTSAANGGGSSTSLVSPSISRSPGSTSILASTAFGIPTSSGSNQNQENTSSSCTSCPTSVPDSTQHNQIEPSHTHTTAIIGGLVGGILAIILAALALCYLLRQRRRRTAADVAPFMASTARVLTTTPSEKSTASAASLMISTTRPQTVSRDSSSHPSAGTEDRSAGTWSDDLIMYSPQSGSVVDSMSRGVGSRGEPPLQHVDSGVRLETREVPPIYTSH